MVAEAAACEAAGKRSAAGNGKRRCFGDERLFFKAWLHDPVVIGAIMPTREQLARAMASAATRTPGARAGKAVVELGGGTGPLTRALLAQAPHPKRVTIVERNPVFHRMLGQRFPQARVILGDAEQLGALLRDHQVGPVGAVVSSLPRVGWPLERQRRILAQCFDLMGSGGVFLEFTYGPFSPVPRALIREFGFVAARIGLVWRNFPPAAIWGYRLRG